MIARVLNDDMSAPVEWRIVEEQDGAVLYEIDSSLDADEPQVAVYELKLVMPTMQIETSVDIEQMRVRFQGFVYEMVPSTHAIDFLVVRADELYIGAGNFATVMLPGRELATVAHVSAMFDGKIEIIKPRGAARDFELIDPRSVLAVNGRPLIVV